MSVVILGIDPGSRITGYGVIAILNKSPVYVSSGCIRLTGKSMPERLHQIHQSILKIIDEFQPQHAAIEQVFMQRNVMSALKLGQARGAALVAMAEKALIIAEYSPREIKNAVVGYGAAQKEQVQHMVATILKLSGVPQVDAADALAVALCHHYTNRELAGTMSS